MLLAVVVLVRPKASAMLLYPIIGITEGRQIDLYTRIILTSRLYRKTCPHKLLKHLQIFLLRLLQDKGFGSTLL